MPYRIRHSTTYRYRRAVALQPHSLRLTPRGDHHLMVTAAAISCSPEAQLGWAQDPFGNLVATATFAAAADRLRIVADLMVDQTAPEWPIFPIDPAAHVYPFRYADEDALDLAPLLANRHAARGDDVAAWARGFVAGPSPDTLSLLKDINAGCGDAIAYRVRAEEGTQTPSQTLAARSGSCRDIAALFIDAVRHLGFAARAVSGYLIDASPIGNEAGSTHAWAEVFLPGAGWIAFDPTHRRLGSANLIPVAVGRCSNRILPVTGGYVGAPDDLVGMDVAVEIVAI